MALPRISVNIPGFMGNEEADEGLLPMFPSLTFKERMYGFGACILMSLLISLSSFGAFTDLLLGYPLRFATLYSFGNLTSMCSTMFLVGPRQQLKNMSHHNRRVSAGIYVFCLLMTLLVAFPAPELKWLIVALVAVQWAALVWYTLSYIPFGRMLASGLASRLLG